MIVMKVGTEHGLVLARSNSQVQKILVDLNPRLFGLCEEQAFLDRDFYPGYFPVM
jgi:hypothetical protein